MTICEVAHEGDVDMTLRILTLHKVHGSLPNTAVPIIDDQMVSNGPEIISVLLREGTLVHAIALAKTIELRDLELFKRLQPLCPDLWLYSHDFPVVSVHKQPQTSLVKIAVLCRDCQFLRHLLSLDGIDIDRATNEFHSDHSFHRVSPLKWTLFENDYGSIKNCSTTPLQAAIALEETDIIKMLIEAGAGLYRFNQPKAFGDIYEFARHSSSPLIWAARTKNIDVVRLMLKDAVRDDIDLALEEAVRQRDRDIAELLLSTFEKTRNIGDRGFGHSALIAAVVQYMTDFLDLLLAYGVSPTGPSGLVLERERSWSTALGWALRYTGKNQIATIVQKLLLAGSDPNGIVQTCFMPAYVPDFDLCSCSRHEVTIENKNRGYYEQHDPCPCISQNRSRQYRELDGSEFENASFVGYAEAKSALVLAIERGHLDIAQLLIDAGGIINTQATARMRLTPLQAACKKGSIEIFDFLIRLGADIHAAPAPLGGGTALQLAAIGGHIYIASVLLKQGVNVNAPGSPVEGRTALEGAAEWGRLDMIQLLLNAGVSIYGEGEWQYRRALRFAKQNGHSGVVELLESAKAKGHGTMDMPLNGTDLLVDR